MTKINEAVAFIKNIYSDKPAVGIVLGSGLGSFTTEINIEKEIPYGDIPHFPVSTVEGHSGKLIFGTLGGKKIVAMAGRFHLYEGYSSDQTVFPIRVLKFLGIDTLLVSNAAGGVNPSFQVGDLMIITDHISIDTHNPLIGRNIDELGPRFPDMSQPYDKDMIRRAAAIAAGMKIRCHVGVYAAVTGPVYETRAEYKYIKFIGADCVGMSTVPEVIVAHHMKLPVFAISIITDMGGHDEPEVITHEEVLRVANAAEQTMTSLIKKLLSK